MEIQRCYQALQATREDETRQEVTQGEEGTRQVLSQEEGSQEGTREENRQEGAQEETGERDREGDETESWQQQSRHKFKCPICGLGRRTKGQIEKAYEIP